MDPTKLMGPLAIAGSGLSILSNLYGLFAGARQTREARQMLNQPLPQYEIPQELERAAAARQMALYGRTPEAINAEQAILANQAGTTFNARQAAPTASAMLGVLGTSQAETNRALLANAAQESAQFEQRLAGMERTGQALGQQRERQFMLNEFLPAQEQRQYARELLAGGQSNIAGSLMGLSSTAGMAFQAEADNQLFTRLFRRAPSLNGTSMPVNQQRMQSILQSRPVGLSSGIMGGQYRRSISPLEMPYQNIMPFGG